MIDKGADIVFGAGGNTGNGALFAAAERADKGVLAIGVDTDQYLTVPEAKGVLLSSAMKLLTPGVFDLIKKVQDGTFKGGNNLGDVGLAPFHDQEAKVSADVKAKLEKLRIEKAKMDRAVAEAKAAAALAKRKAGFTVSEECKNNPLAKGCS
jgi:basic membrane protein A